MIKSLLKNKLRIYTIASLVLVFILNIVIFHFQKYAIFRDYAIVRNQDFVFNNSNPISTIQDLVQNQFLSNISLNIISWIYFTLVFSFGFIISFLSFKSALEHFYSKTNHDKQIKNQKSLSKIDGLIILVSSFIYVYNPFTFERFLMGQDRIVIGYFLLLPILCWILKIADRSYDHHRRDVIITLFLLLCVTFINIHATILATVCVFAFAIFGSKKRNILILISIFSISLMIFSLVLNYNFSSLLNSAHTISNKDNSSIITSFSPQVLANQNIFVRVLSGAASWNTPTFFEIVVLMSKFPWLNFFSLYFNQILNLIYILLETAIFAMANFLLLQNKNTKFLSYSLLAITIPATIFSFGYSLDFSQKINSLIFMIPGSYVFREPGKAIMLVLLVLSVLTIYLYSKINNYILKLIYTITLSIFALSNFLPFSVVASSLNYIEIPKIFNYALNNCNNRNLAYLPSILYLDTKFSNTFITNPLSITKTNNCNIIKPQGVELITRDRNDTIWLESNQGKSLSLDEAIKKYTSNLPVIQGGVLSVDTQNQNQNISNLKQYLIKNKIDLLLIDQDAFPFAFNLTNDLKELYSVSFEESPYILLERK